MSYSNCCVQTTKESESLMSKKNNIIRIYVEKKSEYAFEEERIFEELKKTFNVTGLKNVRIFNRYDIDGVDHTTFEKVKCGIFSENPIDDVFEEKMPKEVVSNKTGNIWENLIIPLEYLPGQYDQRADSAMQCIKLVNPEIDSIVKYTKIIFLAGMIEDEHIKSIKEYFINPVDSQEAKMGKPTTLEMETLPLQDIKIWEGFINKTDKELKAFRERQGFAMSDEDIKHVLNYFLMEEKRNPTETELRVIDTYWSDHCRHTTFNAEIVEMEFDNEKYSDIVNNAFQEYLSVRKKVYDEVPKPISLMDVATIGAKYLKKEKKVSDIDESEEINACSIKIKAEIDGKEEDWLIMFKNETHNHPTEIEPFGGAATCLGGAIRDPLSGRAYVYQAMRVTGAGDPTKSISETVKGKLPQSKICKEATKGYSSYGNQIGLATGLVDEIYHEGYVAKRMEVGAVMAAVPSSHVNRVRPEEGDIVVLLGGRTGRDGVGGATGSSKEHTEGSILECSAEVQKGNPPVERNLQRMFRRKEVSVLIKRCNDFGAGGVSVAVGELADSLHIYLDKVPKKYDGLTGTELAISESQERMAIVIDEKNKDLIYKYANEENIEATEIAKITDSGRMVMEWRGKEIFNISRKFLDSNGARQTAKVKIEQQKFHEDKYQEFIKCNNETVLEKSNKIEKSNVSSQESSIFEILSDINCCSKRGLIENFDSTIGAGTVVMPLGGENQLTPAIGMVAKLPLISGKTDNVTIMTYGFDPYLSEISPFHGGYYAVIDSVTKIVALGGKYKEARLSLQNYFEKLGEDPAKWGKPMAAQLGALKAQIALETPAIGGKDSMSGTFNDINVPPTLISFAVATGKGSNTVTNEFKKPDSKIIMVSPTKGEDGLLDLEEYKKLMTKVSNMIEKEQVLASNTISYGGIACAIVKMSAGNNIGAKINDIPFEKMIDPEYGSLILEISKELKIDSIFEKSEYIEVGKTTKEEKIFFFENGEIKEYRIDDLVKIWSEKLKDIYPTDVNFSSKNKENSVEKINETKKSLLEANVNIRTVKPKIIIPTFPGTNCEIDTMRAFEAAGGDARIEIIKNLSTETLLRSIESLSNRINESQIIMLPGGFSGGDEPDGSAKFITAIFNNEMIREATINLLDRGGLILGICNGFQALIKLGLLTEGKITLQNENSPTLTHNKIGRHMSKLVRTRIVNNHSPWLRKVNIEDIHTVAISHGEGRFVANPDVINSLISKGQIATQYVDLKGNPSMDIDVNPNYSTMAIEGITSEDGRIFGKMGHSERIGDNLYKNIPGNYDQQIFKSGIEFLRK